MFRLCVFISHIKTHAISCFNVTKGSEVYDTPARWFDSALDGRSVVQCSIMDQ